ncbi:MAG TPA: ATP-binding cassette domain-containing protein [Symbiobacteriaceae bacterium]|nr:ATP-binding cassette domain-containing protein [Symbiobacteriaceae bacterium]
MTAIAVEGLVKEYRVPAPEPGASWIRRVIHRPVRCQRAVGGLSFGAAEGEIIGLLGANGAGKTTTIKCLTGIITPTAGRVRVAGFDPHRERYAYTYQIGLVMGQKSLLLWDVPVIESLKLYRDIYELPETVFRQRLAEYAAMLELEPLLGKPVRKLSLGQRMRAEFVAAMLHRPRVLFLDEPTIGLDVLAKERIRQFLLELNRREGTTIILTTHDMRDVEALAGRVLLLDEGRLSYDGSVEALKALQTERTVLLTYDRVVDEVAFARLRAAQAAGGAPPASGAGSLRLTILQGEIIAVTQAAMSALALRDISIEAPSLEQIMRGVLERGLGHGAS